MAVWAVLESFVLLMTDGRSRTCYTTLSRLTFRKTDRHDRLAKR